MEIRDFAELLLRGPRLEDKLFFPTEEFEDSRPAASFLSPDSLSEPPGRERRLRFVPGGPAAAPDTKVGEDAASRARTLHFFANHELLALELMALALLRFPDAPENFRRGVCGMIQEEQTHLRLYLRRMEELGLRFGDLPLNDFFWRHMADCGSPLDFTARMSLTFEQANLDYAWRYARAFARVGDEATAAILKTVLRDEIGHVKNGLIWFGRFAGDFDDLWERWMAALPSRLDPIRARGPVFNIRARLRAGLPRDYIRKLALYSRSRGRPPRVLDFDPLCELSIARGGPVTESAALRELRRDLTASLIFIARPEDVLLTDEIPSDSFLLGLRRAGFEPPEFCMRDGTDGVAERKLWDLEPWGWSPAALSRMREFFPRVVGEAGENLRARFAEGFPSELRRVFSRKFDAELAAAFAAGPGAGDPFLDAVAGRICRNSDEIRAAVEGLRGESVGVVLKSLFSAAGRGLLILRDEESVAELEDPASLVARRVSELQRETGGVVVEPWRARVMDFSVQGVVGPDGSVTIKGVTRAVMDKNGRYRGAVVGRIFEGPSGGRWSSDDLRRLADRKTGVIARLHQVGAWVGAKLGLEGYQGPYGVDAFLYDANAGRGGERELRLRPIVEVNPRYTMGRVALELGRVVRRGRFALWLHFRRADAEALGCRNFDELARKLKREIPLHVIDNPARLLVSGAVPTSDPALARRVLPVLIVEKSLDACLGPLSALRGLPFQA